jgi:segregation and condensation protein B
MGLPALVESLLFVAEEPVAVSRLGQTLGVTTEDVEAALTELAATYQADGGRGIRVQRTGDRVQLVSASEAAPLIERFLGLDLTSRFSPAAMETLAIVAYRQPLTRAEIETIRGVSCDAVLRTLVAHELVEPVGRLEQAGRPFLYGTTFQFLQHFGLESLDALPSLSDGDDPRKT